MLPTCQSSAVFECHRQIYPKPPTSICEGQDLLSIPATQTSAVTRQARRLTGPLRGTLLCLRGIRKPCPRNPLRRSRSYRRSLSATLWIRSFHRDSHPSGVFSSKNVVRSTVRRPMPNSPFRVSHAKS